ncbi:MAG TPA: TetR/AcrR family transcriptional regulator [Solirubrobacterales bacterium]
MSAAARRELIELRASELIAERGYRGASIEEIARRSGVTPPVVYDHFSSKRELYRQLLERHYAELRAVWRRDFPGEEPAEQRIGRSIDAWFAYLEAHPYAARLLFRHLGGDPELDPVHAEVAGASSAEIMPLFAAEPGSENLAGSLETEGLEMAWVVLRGVLQGLALWWADHPEVPRERVVATAMNAVWIGFERVSRGETWTPQPTRTP